MADGTVAGGGADYAEYFEWKDGNTSDEDRVGFTVVLDENKIVASSDSDNASDVIGDISGNPVVVGDTAWNKWNQKHLKDDYEDIYGKNIQQQNGMKKLMVQIDLFHTKLIKYQVM